MWNYDCGVTSLIWRDVTIVVWRHGAWVTSRRLCDVTYMAWRYCRAVTSRVGVTSYHRLYPGFWIFDRFQLEYAVYVQMVGRECIWNKRISVIGRNVQRIWPLRIYPQRRRILLRGAWDSQGRTTYLQRLNYPWSSKKTLQNRFNFWSIFVTFELSESNLKLKRICSVFSQSSGVFQSLDAGRSFSSAQSSIVMSIVYSMYSSTIR